MEQNYYDTMIVAADDSPAVHGTAPPNRGDRKTVAELQYAMLADHPFELTQEDVLFDSWLLRQNFGSLSGEEIAQRRAEFFSKPQPCLRSSPLPKRYGWGFIFDTRGKVALLAVESDEYRQAVESGKVKVLKAMRSSRK